MAFHTNAFHWQVSVLLHNDTRHIASPKVKIIPENKKQRRLLMLQKDKNNLYIVSVSFLDRIS